MSGYEIGLITVFPIWCDYNDISVCCVCINDAYLSYQRAKDIVRDDDMRFMVCFKEKLENVKKIYEEERLVLRQLDFTERELHTLVYYLKSTPEKCFADLGLNPIRTKEKMTFLAKNGTKILQEKGILL